MQIINIKPSLVPRFSANQEPGYEAISNLSDKTKTFARKTGITYSSQKEEFEGKFPRLKDVRTWRYSLWVVRWSS